MALNPDTIQFLVDQLSKAELESFSGIVSQILSYLDNEVKDNPIFDKYESERKSWKDWPTNEESYPVWTLPKTLELSKSLAYDIYRTIAEKGYEFALNLSFTLFNQTSISDNLDRLNNTFLEYFIQALKDITNANPEVDVQKPKGVRGNIAFIIHGHDNELKNEVLLLFKRAGVNAFVLHEQADRGRTIIDKLLEETNPAAYAIALLTPDDVTHEGTNRARQNVILEIGYFLGRLGKERLRMIVKGNVEIPSDLYGILYEKHDESGAWKIKLLKEMQAVGIYVDMQAAISTF
jgi:predicted nucleotide-binding protein